ncbi:unnamed protein product, partial [Musa acuminata subsp. burmannicoides]
HSVSPPSFPLLSSRNNHRTRGSTTSPTGSPAHPSLAALSPSLTSTAPSRGLFLCGAPAQGQRRLARRSNGRHRF